MTEHPTPWRVEYDRRFPEWNEKGSPYIVDANGATVARPALYGVCHPGLYDELADKTAHQIVNAVNFRAQQQEWAKQIVEHGSSPTIPTPRKPVINE